MKVVTGLSEIQALAQGYREQSLRVALVPTMGWFHEGHLSLMRKARECADRVIVSLFINPMQFGPSEDLSSYPHDLERDCRLAEAAGVDVLFAPEKKNIYPDNFSSTVLVKGLSTPLCGASRPGHFDGVTTIVAKLFNLTLPHVALFGEKDFQQLAVIRQMVEDLAFPIEVVGHPIVRDKSGLALSSRNSYLGEDEMAAARSLSQGLAAAKECVVSAGVQGVSVGQLKDLLVAQITRHPECSIDYIEIVDRCSLQVQAQLTCQSIIVMAVTINNRIRLIDNLILEGSLYEASNAQGQVTSGHCNRGRSEL